MDESLQYKIKQYWAPIVLLTFGLLILFMGIYQDPDSAQIKQTARFLYGGIAFILAAIINFLFIANKISNKLTAVLTTALLLASAGMIVLNYNSIAEPIDWKKQKETRDAEVIQRMIDTRTAQMQYKDEFFHYANNYDTLIDFIKNGKVAYVKGDSRPTPERSLHQEEADKLEIERDSTKFMTERQAVILGYITRDTLEISVMELLFTREEVASKRPKDLIYDFHPDSLRYLPLTPKEDGKQVEFFMGAAAVPSGRQVAQTFMIKDMRPYDPFRDRDTLTVGSLTELSTGGSWGD